MTTETGYRHIVRDPEILSGEPVVRGTRVPVRAIVETWRMGVPVEEIQSHFPHLSLGQVFDALGYFSDHQDEILDHIERNRIPPEAIHPALRSK
jgi:uncharacterized protein (DUF433 family)